ncbi:class I SAM-dependent methyltransferase [Pukyongia salina]|nr:class I SAM-dependent methyltransferase [Pukyongia salina]
MERDNLTEYLSTKDFLVTGETFHLMYDKELDMLCTSPQPNSENLSRYYESDAYISHTDSGRGLLAMLYQTVKKYSLKKKTGLIKKINKKPGSLLDIGAGTGAFLYAAKKNGWKIDGVEPNEKARDLATEKGIELLPALDDIENKQYDVVTLWHVLEHLPDLDNVVGKISDLVKPGGNLVIAVPNFKSYDANYYKEFWAAYDTPRHLWHFSKIAVKKIFKEDFQLIECKPMMFDSFYVSLLSEKYKNGRSFSLGAIFTGLRSNLRGFRTKEYSSHIYLFRKHQ